MSSQGTSATALSLILMAAAMAQSPSSGATGRADAAMTARAAVSARPGGAARVAAANQIERHRPPSISDGEAARIRHQMKALKQMKRAAKADGEISRAERERLQHQQEQIRTLIQTAKNN